jgi:SAM-dependent methyltransferase
VSADVATTGPTWFAGTGEWSDPVGALRVALFADLLGRFTPGRLVDLGAGHGIFARVAADLGWEVTAVDARDERFPDDPRVQWVRSDIRAFLDQELDVDVVACLGLWYHLTLDDQRTLARCCAPRPLILDTHVGMPSRDDHPGHRKQLSDVRDQDGFAGRLYHERGLRTRLTAAWGNEYSFWPTLASLERQLTDAGYDVVEQISPAVAPDRRFFLARTIGDAARARLDATVTRYVSRVPSAAAPTATAPAP